MLIFQCSPHPLSVDWGAYSELQQGPSGSVYSIIIMENAVPAAFPSTRDTHSCCGGVVSGLNNIILRRISNGLARDRDRLIDINR